MTRRQTRKGASAWSGRPYPLGADYDGEGTNFALWSTTATAVSVCLFDTNGIETRIPLADHTYHVWHGYVPGVGPGRRAPLQPGETAARPVRPGDRRRPATKPRDLPGCSATTVNGSAETAHGWPAHCTCTPMASTHGEKRGGVRVERPALHILSRDGNAIGNGTRGVAPAAMRRRRTARADGTS